MFLPPIQPLPSLPINCRNMQEVQALSEDSLKSEVMRKNQKKTQEALRRLGYVMPYVDVISKKHQLNHLLIKLCSDGSAVPHWKGHLLEHPLFPKGALISKTIAKGSFSKFRIVVDIDSNKVMAAKVCRLGLQPIYESHRCVDVDDFVKEVLDQNKLCMPSQIVGVFQTNKMKATMLQDVVYDANLQELLGFFHQFKDKLQTNSNLLGNASKQAYNGGNLLNDIVQDIACQIAKQLCMIHQKDYVHGDIKADNIFVQVNEQEGAFSYRLGDMGSAQQLSRQCSSLLGSPLFRAPETLPQSNHFYRVSAYNQAIDVWSLGQTLLQVILNRPILSELFLGKEHLLLTSDQFLEPFLDWRNNVIRDLSTKPLTAILSNQNAFFPHLSHLSAFPQPEVFQYILEHMLHPDPTKRVTAAQVVDFFQAKQTAKALHLVFLAKISVRERGIRQRRICIEQLLQTAQIVRENPNIVAVSNAFHL